MEGCKQPQAVPGAGGSKDEALSPGRWGLGSHCRFHRLWACGIWRILRPNLANSPPDQPGGSLRRRWWNGKANGTQGPLIRCWRLARKRSSPPEKPSGLGGNGGRSRRGSAASAPSARKRREHDNPTTRRREEMAACGDSSQPQVVTTICCRTIKALLAARPTISWANQTRGVLPWLEWDGSLRLGTAFLKVFEVAEQPLPKMLTAHI